MNKKLNTNFYSNLGGINLKASDYTLNRTQFLDIRNCDFDVPNALQKRPGSTQAVGVATSGPITSLFEYQKLTGESWIVAGSNSAMFLLASGSYTLLADGFNNGQPADMLTFVNKLFVANGQTLITWDGTNMIDSPFCPCVFLGPGTVVPGGTSASYAGITMPYLQAWFFYAFLKKDGSVTPANPYSAAPLYSVQPADTPTFIAIQGFTTPPPSGVGYSAINLYTFMKGGTTPFFGMSGSSADALSLQAEYISQFKRLTSLPLGTTIATFHKSSFLWETIVAAREGFSGNPFCFGNTFSPKYIEVNQNVVFMAGFSNAPSDVWFTDIGQPSNVQPEYQFEVRTNDGDRIMGHKAYNNSVIVFKERSFHKVIGSTPEDFQLVELSTQFGCLSNKAIVEFNEKLLFLDKKGIVQYDGAGWKIVSDQIDEVFRRMNLSAAKELAVGVNYSYRNQVWFGIPVDGSTANNLTIVYDYLIDAWTFFDGFNASSFAFMKGTLERPTVWRGSPSGMISYFSESLFADDGQPIACSAFTHFDKDKENQTNVWRRLFLDVAAVGTTSTITGDIYANYNQQTPVKSFTMGQGQFQSKTEFGVMAKAAAVEFTHNSASLPFLLNGYSWSKRKLRDV